MIGCVVQEGGQRKWPTPPKGAVHVSFASGSASKV